MAYLTINDLKTFLDEREIAALKRDNETDGENKIPVGISYAENFVKDRLVSRFDVDYEYSKSGEFRSSTLLEVITHIAIWKLCATFPTIQLDGKRHYFYEGALKQLDEIASGKINIGLPLLSNPTNTAGIVYGVSTSTEIIY